MPPSADRQGLPARRPGAGAITAVAVALVAVVLAAATGGGWSVVDRFGLWGRLGQQPPAPPSDVAPRTSSPGSDWLSGGLIVAAGAVLAVGIVLIWRSTWVRQRFGGWWRRGRAPVSLVVIETDSEATRRHLRGGLDEALRLVQQLSDPTEAIVAAWLALQEAAAMIGTPRGPADTPTEFTAKVLAYTPADRIAVGALLQLYHRARFSTGGVGADARASARRCLSDLADSWYRFDAAWSAQNGE